MIDNETKKRLKFDFVHGILSRKMLCAKYNVGPDILTLLIQVGDGDEGFPLPWRAPAKRTKTSEETMRKVASMASVRLTPDEQFLSPHDQNALLTAEERECAADLTQPDLEYANLVLRGVGGVPAAIQAFNCYGMDEARKISLRLSREPRIRRYMEAMRAKSCLAVIRDRAWAEAVLHRCIDRCMELEQDYTLKGEIITGQCKFDPKGVTSAIMLLMRLKGWDKETSDTSHEPQHERVKRLATQGRVLEGELTNDTH